MPLYSAIDLHAKDHVVVVVDEEDRVLEEKRLPNDLGRTLGLLEPYRERLAAVAVESTFNWYWLVDGLEADGFEVVLVNTSAVCQYEGLKYTDDKHDARWLAHLMRLGILPTGYITPKKDREVRDVLRQRARLVRQRTANLLSLKNLLARETGRMMPASELKRLSPEAVRELVSGEMLANNAASLLAILETQSEQIERLEGLAEQAARTKTEVELLRSIAGIGPVLSLAIAYETGDVRRFPSAGRYASYCRCVKSERRSAGKKKGQGNRKNGNAYLSWAFVEAAHCVRRFQPAAQRFYERKRSQSGKTVLATKALAHKLARAFYYVMRDQVPYDPARLFG